MSDSHILCNKLKKVKFYDCEKEILLILKQKKNKNKILFKF